MSTAGDRRRQRSRLGRGYRLAAGAVLALGVALSARTVWWGAAAHGAWPDKSQDTYLYFYPNLAYLRHSLALGFGLLWNGLQNCGQPAYANPQAGALYPTAWLFLVVDPPLALALTSVLHLCLGPLGILSLAYVLRLRPVAALTGAMALLTAGRTAQLSDWQPSGFIAYMWMPWAFAAAERGLRRPGASAAVLLGVVLTLQLLAGSPQLSLFTYEVLALRCLWELVTSRRRHARRGVLVVGAGAILPVGLAAAMLLPAIEFTRASIRSARLGTADLVGGGLTPSWAEFRRRLGQPLSDSAICAPWFLGLAGLAAWARVRRRVAIFYLLAAMLFLALSFDGPVFALYRQLPFGEMFRFPARFRNVTAMIAAILVACGTHAFVSAWRRHDWRRWIPPWAPLLGVGAFSWLSLSRPDPFTLGYASLLVAIGLVGTARRGADRRRAWPRAVALWAMALPIFVVVVQASISAPRAKTPARVATLFGRAPELRELASMLSLQDRAYLFRDADAVRGEDWSVVPKSSSLFDLRGVSDYEPQVSQRFADVLLRLRGHGPYAGFARFEAGSEAPRNRPLLNLVAARFLVGNSQAPPALGGAGPPLREVRRDGRFAVLENPAALPRAFYVPMAEIVADPAGILRRLATVGHDPRRVALIEAPPVDGFLGTRGGVGSATIDSDRGEVLRLTVQASAPGFLFLSDQDYPGWSATVNGVEAPILRANYAFRLVRVPAGEARVVFRYAPRSVRWGAAISLATGLALVAGFLVRRWRLLGRGRPTTNQ